MSISIADKRRGLTLAIWCCIGVVVLLSASMPVGAQQNAGNWSVPEGVLPATGHDETAVTTDSQGVLHALWSTGLAAPGERPVLFYASLQDDAWSTPIDVLVGEPGRAILWPVLASGPDDSLYACWNGSNGRVFFSSTFAGAAADARSWREPAVLSSEPTLHCDLAVSPDGAVHLLYAATGGDIFYLRSDDGGQIWHNPVSISQFTEAMTGDYPRLSVGADGMLHAVWTAYALTEGNPVLSTHYARSANGGESWSSPLTITRGEDYAQIAVLAEGDRHVHLAWNGRIGFGGRYYQYSLDNGQSWSEVQTVLPTDLVGAGKTGPPDMAVDSDGTLHLVSGLNPGGVAYVHGFGGSWSAPTVLPSPSGWAEKAQVAVANGNQLHVVWQEWHARQTLSATEVVSPTAVAVELTPTAVVTQSPLALTPTPERTPDQALAQDAPDSPWINPLLLSVMIVAALLGVFLIVVIRRKR